MTQNPYAESGFDDAISEPPRTSVTAILALAISLLGFCTPLSFVGALLGIFALLGIGRSNGRVSGRGLAIAAIIVGIVMGSFGLAAYTGYRVKLVPRFQAYRDRTGPVIADIEAGDFTSARTALSPSVTITDEQFTQFHNAYVEQLGAYKGTPKGLVELIQIFADPAVGPNMQQNQGRNDMIPIPGLFDQGPALMLFKFNPSQKSGDRPLYTDITIVLPDGTSISLSDPLPEPEAAPDEGG